jgi:hypothetical protein
MHVNNTYSSNGSTTYLEVPGPKGALLIFRLDTEDFPIAAALPGTWCAKWSKSAKTYYVSGNVEGAFPGKRASAKRVFLHRAIMNAPVDRDVDHLFHDGLDGRKQSLAIKTRSQNLFNRKGPQSNSTTGLLGVQRVSQNNGDGRIRKGYIGQLRLNGTKYRSSVRHTPEVASAWYWAKRRFFGIPEPGQRQEVPIELAA